MVTGEGIVTWVGMVTWVGIGVDDHGIGTLSMEAGGTFTLPVIHLDIGVTACTDPADAAIHRIGEVMHRTRMARPSIASSLAPRFATPIHFSQDSFSQPYTF